MLKEIVGPAHQRAKRLLTLQCYAAAPAQELEAIVQPLVDLSYRKRPQAGCGKLQRQRNALEAGTELRHCRCLQLIQHEAGFLQSRTLDEELYRFRSHESHGVGVALRHPERKDGIGLFSAYPQHLAARGDDS